MAFCLALLLVAWIEDLQTKLKVDTLDPKLAAAACAAVPGEELSWCAALMCRIVLEVKDWSPSRDVFPASSLLINRSVLVKLVDRVRACTQGTTS